MTTTTEPTPAPIFAEITAAETIEEAVHLTVGAASACWSNLPGAGVFQDHDARAIAAALIERIPASAAPVEEAGHPTDEYVAHKDTDKLLQGHELRAGMVIRPEGYLRHRDGWDQWATISRVIVDPMKRDLPAQVSFIATREDGSLASFGGACSHWWIARKDHKMPGDGEPSSPAAPEEPVELVTAAHVGASKAARWLQCHGHAEAAAALAAAITDGEITPNGHEPTESAELRRCGAQAVAAWVRAAGFLDLAARIETAMATEELIP